MGLSGLWIKWSTKSGKKPATIWLLSMLTVDQAARCWLVDCTDSSPLPSPSLLTSQATSVGFLMLEPYPEKHAESPWTELLPICL